MNRSFTCPVCGKPNLGFSPNPELLRWKFNCFSCPETGASYMKALAELLGVKPATLLSDPPFDLLDEVGYCRDREPDPLPTNREVRRWRDGLFESVEAFDYVRHRGLSEQTLRRFWIGFDGRAIVFPCRDANGALVNIKRRALPGSEWSFGKAKGLAGIPAVLYPDVPACSWSLVCEGEFDALLARQHGLPAVTTTCGQEWPDALVEQVQPKGRAFAICFDVGAQKAEEVALKLLGAGAREVRIVHLPLAEKGADLSDWLLAGGTKAEFFELVRAARRAG